MIVDFCCYIQPIVRVANDKGVQCESFNHNFNFYEILFRPSVSQCSTEEFYDNLQDHDRKNITHRHILWLIRNIDNILNYAPSLKSLSFNVNCHDVKVMMPLLLKLHQYLSRFNVSLIIELTERKRMFNQELKKSLRILHQQGVIFSIDDFTFEDLYHDFIQSDVITYIKVKFEDIVKLRSTTLFSDIMINKKELVIEKIELFDQLKQCSDLPVSFYQGWLFSKPQKI